MTNPRAYRGRIAPTPTGDLHLGHAATFLAAAKRAADQSGQLVLRIEDLDPLRCRPEFTDSAISDLRWLGIQWHEGPDVSGPFAPYCQSQRREFYLQAWHQLRDGGWIYPCKKSRREIAQRAPNAPHDDEPIFPIEWREPAESAQNWESPTGMNWRFRVPDDERITFSDGRMGEPCFIAGQDFGDFLIWNRDDIPAYELAVVVDDDAMQISEVVRGEDLLRSTARQLLLFRALSLPPPKYYHTELIRDANGRRLAKRHKSLALSALRASGHSAHEVLSRVSVP